MSAEAIQLTDEQSRQLLQLKAHFPYRYCFAAFNPTTGDYQTHAVFSYPTRKMKKLAGAGYTLFELAK